MLPDGCHDPWGCRCRLRHAHAHRHADAVRHGTVWRCASHASCGPCTGTSSHATHTTCRHWNGCRVCRCVCLHKSVHIPVCCCCIGSLCQGFHCYSAPYCFKTPGFFFYHLSYSQFRNTKMIVAQQNLYNYHSQCSNVAVIPLIRLTCRVTDVRPSYPIFTWKSCC